MKRQKAFTLVELVVTIAVVIILSMIAVPVYKGYITKAKMVEGYVLLNRIRDAQIAYYNEYRCFYNYNTLTNNEEVLEINARTNKYFTCFVVGYPGDKKGFLAGLYLQNVFPRKPRFLMLQYDITAGDTIYEHNYWTRIL